MENQESSTDERRKYPAEVAYTRMLQDYIDKEVAYKKTTENTLLLLQDRVDKLTASTKEVISSYETAQQAIKVSAILGRTLKFIGSLVILYYSIIGIIHDPKL
jgi:hypothetical protein